MFIMQKFSGQKKNLSRLYKFFSVCRKLVQIAHFFLCVQLRFVFWTRKNDWKKVSVLDIHRFWILPFWAPISVRWVATFYLIHFLEKKYKKTAIGAVEGKIQNLYSLKCKLYNFFCVQKNLSRLYKFSVQKKKLVQFGQVFFCLQLQFVFLYNKIRLEKSVQDEQGAAQFMEFTPEKEYSCLSSFGN